MTEAQINRMIDKGRIILRPIDALVHYALIFAIGTLNLLAILLAWNQAPPNPTRAMMTNKDIITWTIIDVFLLGAFYLIQRERLKLKKETIDLADDEIRNVINEVGVKFNWTPSTVTKEFIQADSMRILGTDNRITIFIRGKTIYLNCRTTFGEIGGFFRQDKIADEFLTRLRMRSYEIQHQNGNGAKQASR